MKRCLSCVANNTRSKRPRLLSEKKSKSDENTSELSMVSASHS